MAHAAHVICPLKDTLVPIHLILSFDHIPTRREIFRILRSYPDPNFFCPLNVNLVKRLKSPSDCCGRIFDSYWWTMFTVEQYRIMSKEIK